jgi:hypothetical protein
LAAFEAAREQLRDEGIDPVAGSVDGLDEARTTVADLSLAYPVAYGLPLSETSRTLGAFFETRRSILHATGYVVRPDATVAVACYSTGPIGRLEVEDVLRLVRFYKARA